MAPEPCRTCSNSWNLGPSAAPSASEAPAWGDGSTHNSYPAYDASQAIDSGADSLTRSSDGDLDHHDPELQGLLPPELDEHLFRAYQHAKSRWRRYMKKPVRRARPFLKRHPNWEGQGRERQGTWQRSLLLPCRPHGRSDRARLVSAHGEGKGKSRSSGKGKGRKRNPIGADGQVMKYSICGSDTHFRAQCPQNWSTAGHAGF